MSRQISNAATTAPCDYFRIRIEFPELHNSEILAGVVVNVETTYLSVTVCVSIHRNRRAQFVCNGSQPIVVEKAILSTGEKVGHHDHDFKLVAVESASGEILWADDSEDARVLLEPVGRLNVNAFDEERQA